MDPTSARLCVFNAKAAMNRPISNESSKRLSPWRWFGVMAAALLGLVGSLAAEDPKAPPENEAEKSKEPETKTEETEAEPEAVDDEESAAAYVNWLDVGIGGLILDGDKARAQQRLGMGAGGYGGIEDFHWEFQPSKKTYFEMDTRAMFDQQDYALRYELTRPEFGFFRGGFKQYRTYYDGSGGFYPPSGTWFSLDDDALELDRGEVWVEAGLLLPKIPQITFKYTYQYRTGEKNSTSWGDSNFTVPSSSSPLDLRAMVPSFWDIDEKRHLLQGDVKHHVGKTELGLGLRYEMSEVDNALKGRRRPDEGSTQDRYLTSRQQIETDLLNLRAYSETRLNEKIRFSSGYAFTTLDTDLSGSRIYGDAYDVGYRQDYAYAQGFNALAGGSQMDQHVVHLNLMASPWTNLVVVPSLRIENLGVDSQSSYLLTGPAGIRPDEAASERSLIDVAERLDVRFTGLTNWVLYTRGDWSQSQGDLTEKGGVGPTLDYPGVLRNTDDAHFTQKYTVGANWYPSRRLNIDLQYYFKQRENEYDHDVDSTFNDGADAYPAFFHLQRFETDDINCRFTLRPWKNVTLVTRYDFQYSRTASTPEADAALSEAIQSEINSHILGQSLTWIPWSRLYLQASVNYAQDETDTPANRYSAAAADWRNRYWTASLTTGLVVDNKTDLQLNYFFYQAHNALDNAEATQPYGGEVDEHGITVTLTRRLSKQLRLTLKYGYFQYRDSAVNGYNDYDAHLIYSGLHYRF